MQMVQFECARHWKPSIPFFSGGDMQTSLFPLSSFVSLLRAWKLNGDSRGVPPLEKIVNSTYSDGSAELAQPGKNDSYNLTIICEMSSGFCGPSGGRRRARQRGARAAGAQVAGQPDGALRLALPQHQDRGNIQAMSSTISVQRLRCLQRIPSRDINVCKQI